MNMIFKIILFTLCLNVATGIMMNLLPDVGSNPAINPNLNAEDKLTMFNTKLNSTISPTPESTNSFYRLLDSLNLGVISKFLQMMNSFLFGFVDFLDLLFHSAGGIPSGIKGLIIGVITATYIMGAFWLWTGKNLTS